MRYDDYAQKVEKVAKIKRFVAKNIIAFLIVGIIVAATAITLTSVKGTVIDKEDYTNTIEYGGEIDYTADAVFTTVDYEYCVKGTDEWTNVVPREAGEYCVRAIAKSAFGATRYGDSHDFTITTKALTVVTKEKEITFGNTPSVTADALIPGDTISCSEYVYGSFAKTTTTISPILESVVILDKDGNNVTDSYTITIAESEIKFKKKSISITTATANKIYDGTPLEKQEYVLSQGELRQNDRIEIEYKNSITYYGAIDNKASISIFDDEDTDVTINYSITTNYGRLTINKRPITIKSKSASYIYDDKDHTLSNIYDVLYYEDNAIANDNITVISDTTVHNVTAEQGVQNEIEISISQNGTLDVTDCYDVTYEYGTLGVTKRSLTIETVENSWIFDGEIHQEDNFNVTYYNNDNLGHVVKVISAPVKIQYCGTVKNEKIVKVYQPSTTKDIDVSENYNINYVYKDLTVTKRPLVITTNSNSWVYDDVDHCDNGQTVTSGSFISDKHYIEAKKNSETYVHNVTETAIDNVVEYVIYEKGTSKIITDNYDLTVQYGTLLITKRPVSIVTADDEWMYDNKAHSNNNVEMIAYGDYSLLSGHKLENKTSTTFVKTYNYDGVPNEVTFDIVDGKGNVVTNNYDFEDKITYGTLKITKRPILITSDSNEKVYDNKPLTCGTYKISQNTIADGDEENVTITSSITCVKFNSNNEIVGVNNKIDSVKIYEGEDDKTENYDILTVFGTLKILQREITITAGNAEKVYDNTALTLNTKESLTFAFTGEKPDDYGYIADGDDFTFEILSSIIYVEYANGVVVSIPNKISSFAIKEDENSKENNYKVTLVDGYLKILPREITITTGSKSKVYDNYVIECAEHSVKLINTTGEPNATGDEITITVYPEKSFKTVGEIKNKCSYEIKEGETDKSSNYMVNIVEGTLSITKRKVTVTANDDSKVFNNTALTCHTYVLSFTEDPNDGYGCIADGDKETVTFTTSSSITYVKDSDVLNKIDKVTVSDGADKTENYEFTFVDGKLSITPFSINATTASHAWVYNCCNFEDKTVTLSAVDGASDDDIAFVNTLSAVATNSVKIRNAGETDNALIFKIVIDNTDITDNFTFNNIAYGKLKVVKRYITILSGSTSKTYDGKVLEYKNYAINLTEHTYDDGIEVPTGDTTLYRLEIDVTNFATMLDVVRDSTDPSIIKSIQNTYIYSFTKEEYEHNYVIDPQYGTLTINPLAITISAKSAVYVYNNEVFSLTGYTCASLTEDGKTLITGDKLTVTVSSQAEKDVGKYDIEVNDDYSMALNDDDKTKNYNVTLEKGTLEIVKRKIKISSESVAKVYDGTALSATTPITEYISIGYVVGAIQPTGENIPAVASGDTLNIEITANITDAGSTLNEISYSFDGEQGSNYDVEVLQGTLTVNRRAISISSDGATKIYDGTSLSTDANAWSYSITNADGDIPSCDKLTVALGTSITNAGNADNTINYTIVSATDGTIDRSNNYTVTTKPGKLTVLQRKIKITSGSAEKPYDGTALTKKDGYTIELVKTGYAGGLTLGDEESASASGETITVDIKTSMLNVKLVNGVVSTIDNSFTNDDITVENGDINNYEVEKVFGTLKITQVEISATTATDTFEYDGTLHSNTTVTFSPASRGDITFSARVKSTTPTFKYVSDSGKNKFDFVVIDQSGKEINDNFILNNITYGTITITKRSITIANADVTKYYDGNAITGNYELTSGSLASGDTLTVEYNYASTLVDAGTTTATISSYALTNAENYNVTCDTTASSTLTINKRPIKIVTGSKSKEYDGTALTYNYFYVDKNANDLSGSPLVSGDSLIANVNGTITDVGETNNTILSYSFTSGNANNYDVDSSSGLGKLTVTQCTVLVKIISSNTGTLTEGTDYNIVKGKDVLTANNHTLTVTLMKILTYSNYSSTIKDSSNTNVKSNYNVIIDSNVIWVEVQNLTAQNGTLSESDYTIKTGELDDGDTMTITKTADHTYSATVKDSNNSDVTSNYNITITEKEEEEEQEKTEIVVTPNSIDKMYDGTPLEPNGYTYTGTLPDGYYIDTCTLSGSQTIVGSSAITVTSFIIRNSAGVDCTSDFDVKLEEGTLTVTQRIVVICILDNGIENGATLTLDEDYTVLDNITPDDLPSILDGDTLVVVKNSSGIYECSINPNENTNNYSILIGLYVYVTNSEASDGTLTETTGDNASGDYIVLGSYSVPDVLTVTKSGTKYTGTMTRDTQDVTSSYFINIKADDDEEETKTSIVVKPNTITKVYDGTALEFTNPVTGENDELKIIPTLPTGYTYSATIRGSQTEVGSTTSTIENITIYDSLGNDVTDEFNITKKTGNITVTRAIITLKISPKTTIYGNSVTFTNSDAKIVSGLSDDFELALDFSNVQTLTEVGVYNTSIFDDVTFTVLNKSSTDVSQNFALYFGTGTVATINVKTIKISTIDATKDYDGTPLTSSECEITGSLLSGHSLAYIDNNVVTYITITGTELTLPASMCLGSIINTGSVDNEIDKSNLIIVDTSVIADGGAYVEAGDVTSNYYIDTSKSGKLIIE